MGGDDSTDEAVEAANAVDDNSTGQAVEVARWGARRRGWRKPTKPIERGSKAVWTFAHTVHASSFVWDPTLGVESEEPASLDDKPSSDNPDDGNASNDNPDDDNLVSGAQSFS